MPSPLFSPLRLRGVDIDNRIVVAPMCQYSAEDGRMTDWHLMHLGQFAVSGPGLVMTEMIDVEPEGRIGPGCVGLYSDACEEAIARVVAFCRRHGQARLGIQLSHAGRKSSIRPPWEGRRPIPPEAGGWIPKAPSAVAVAPGEPPPAALTIGQLADLKAAFVAATGRAARIGFDLLELHAAHGYLLHQFLSPLANRRTDAYGGSLENRMRFPLELFEAMRRAWPEERPMGVKLSALDWCEGGWTLEEAIRFCQELKERSCDWVTVSSGGIVWTESIPAEPGFQIPFAARIRRETGLPVAAVGLITEPRQAESIVAEGEADLVALARGMLWNPRWAWHAAEALGEPHQGPPQYARSAPRLARDTFATGAAAKPGSGQ